MNLIKFVFGKDRITIILFFCVILFFCRSGLSQYTTNSKAYPGPANTGSTSPDSSRSSVGLTSREGSSNPDRPPAPVKKPQDLQYPENFLSPSKEKTKTNDSDPEKSKDPAAKGWEPDPNYKKRGSDLHGDFQPDQIKTAKKDPTMVFASILASLGFGVFALSDYRYRCRLQEVLSRNNRLLSPEATSSDFAELAHSALGGTSPFAFSGSASPAFNKYMDDFKTSGSYPSTGLIGSSVPDIRPLADHEFYTEK
ncbi:MAG: hypothetical protein Q4G69_06815 [Planctomycetia bacterium]|nr:hypothetical protein [Planctomycetia bacterium]